MSDPKQEVIDLEKRLPALKGAYEAAMRAFLAHPQDQARVTLRRQAVQDYHAAAVEYFNSHERLICLGSLCGASDDPTWYTDKAETAANLLETIEIHYRSLAAKADELHLSRDMFKPSMKAYANMQRLVKATDGPHAARLRALFLANGLPTHGFDTEEAARLGQGPYAAGLWERIVAAGAAIVVLGTVLYSAIRNAPFADPNQVAMMRITLSFAVATLGAVIPGFLHVGLGHKGLAIRAGGALALFVITYFFTPAVLPPHP